MNLSSKGININRIRNVDLVESIAIIFVVMYHSSNYSVDFLTGGDLVCAVSYWFRTILSTCVPLFFFINGFLLFNKDFILKKHIIKIIKLILLTGIWGIITLFLFMIIKNEYFTIKEFIKALWQWKYGWIHHLWFMGTLICIYCFFPLLKNCYDTNKKIFYFFISISALLTFGNKLICEMFTIALNLFFNYTKEINTNLFNMFNPFRGIYGYAFVYFCCGGLISNFVHKIQEQQKRWNLIAISLLIINMTLLFGYGTFVSYMTGKIWDVVWNGYDTIFTFCNVIVIFILSLNYNYNNYTSYKLIKLISINTLGIYFLHWIYIPVTIKYIREYTIFSNVFGNFVYAIAVVIMSLITIGLIKKIPIIKHLV